MKVLNLYAGIGGNRKLWDKAIEANITAIEHDKKIAEIYQDFFPGDEVIVADAHEFLRENMDDFDFIWSSPPCPTHSRIRYNMGFKADRKYDKVEPEYPDMRLYQEIILLDYWFEGSWVVENTNPYYDPLIPAQEVHRHLFWSDFQINNWKPSSDRKHSNITGSSTVYGFNISDYDVKNKRKILRNMVDPELGKIILQSTIDKHKIEYNQATLFGNDKNEQ